MDHALLTPADLDPLLNASVEMRRAMGPLLRSLRAVRPDDLTEEEANLLAALVLIDNQHRSLPTLTSMVATQEIG